jgi:hypothetical protein
VQVHRDTGMAPSVKLTPELVISLPVIPPFPPRLSIQPESTEATQRLQPPPNIMRNARLETNKSVVHGYMAPHETPLDADMPPSLTPGPSLTPERNGGGQGTAPQVKLTPELGLGVSLAVIPPLLSSQSTEPEPAESPRRPQPTTSTIRNARPQTSSGGNPSEGSDSGCCKCC